MTMTIPSLLELTHRATHRAWTAAGSQQGHSHSVFEYLRVIRDQPRPSESADSTDHEPQRCWHMSDLVEAMRVTKPSASAMVVKLEEQGLVERVPCRTDRRAQHLRLTPGGAEVLREGEAVYQQAAEELRRVLGDEAYAALAQAVGSGVV